jgi:hypothetical protein
LAILAATTTTKSHGDLLPPIMASQQTDLFTTKIQPTLVKGSIANESQWGSMDGA